MRHLGCHNLGGEDDLAQDRAEITLAAVLALLFHDVTVEGNDPVVHSAPLRLKVLVVKGGANTDHDIAGGTKNQDDTWSRKRLTADGCFSIEKHHGKRTFCTDEKQVVVARHG
jgi:hypothetical protein